jgi:polyisoprenoid-binding protein YceI
MRATRVMGLVLGLVLGLVAALVGAIGFAEARSVLRINPAKTTIAFSIDAVGWPTTQGYFRDFDGKIVIDLDSPSKSSVEFKVAAASVDVGEPDMTAFVKSYAMLDVDKHPVIRFRSTEVERTGDRSVAVTGEMEFYGAKRQLTFTVDVDRGSGAFGFVAKGLIQRSAFGFNSGQPLISDEVTVTVQTAGTLE